MFVALICLIFGLEFGVVKQEVEKTKSNIQTIINQYNQTAEVYNQFLVDNNLSLTPLQLIESFNNTTMIQDLLQSINLVQSDINQDIQFQLMQQIYQLTKIAAKIQQACVFIGQIIPIEQDIFKKLYNKDQIIINGFKYIKLDGGNIANDTQLYNIYNYYHGNSQLPQTLDQKILGQSTPYQYDDTQLGKLDIHQQETSINKYKFDVSDVYPKHSHNIFWYIPTESQQTLYGKSHKSSNLADLFVYQLDDTNKPGADQVVQSTVQSNISTDILDQDPIKKQEPQEVDVGDPYLNVVWLLCVDIIDNVQ